LAVVLVGRPPIVLLDEPTRGLDYSAKHALVATLQRLRDAGCAVVVATHDVELAAEVADRVILLGDGEVVADEAARELLAGSPAFSPQVARVAHPAPLLTVREAVAVSATGAVSHA
jgi:energy-coupling factor transport system ATP-binding protein